MCLVIFFLLKFKKEIKKLCNFALRILKHFSAAVSNSIQPTFVAVSILIIIIVPLFLFKFC